MGLAILLAMSQNGIKLKKQGVKMRWMTLQA